MRGDRLTTTVVRLVEAGERQAHEAIREDALASLRTELLEMVEAMGVKTTNEVKAQGHRLSHLLARTALESMAARVTAGHTLHKLYGNDLEKAKQLYGSAWNQAVEKLKNPTPGVRTTLNEISEGAGAQEPAALVSLAEAARQLQQGLGVVSALVQRVEALEKEERVTQSGMGELAGRVQGLTGQLLTAINHLEDAQEEASKPRGMFGGRK
ncbi:hypothetical protein [Deinococcus frigens]|uniref:hypothetical protein n=1 Tax=Deinococcus frigens TaxID=249403 RepID=UPI0039F13F75